MKSRRPVGAAFLAIGFAFAAMGMAGQRAFTAVGIVFVAFGIVFLVRHGRAGARIDDQPMPPGR